MYRGFEKLEELNVTNNHFQSGHDFIGVIGLPALKRIWLQGNTFIKRLVLENRVHEFSELISELQDMHKIRVMDMHYGEYGGKESRGLAYVGKVLSRRRKREMRMEQFEDNNVPVTKPHNVQEVYPKSPSRLTEDNLSRILNEKSGTKNGRKTISKVNLDNLLPTERNLWKVAGVQVDDIGKTPGTVSTRHTTATISKYTSTGVSADATFLTGVDIETSAQNKKMETLIRNAPAVISFDWEKGLDFNGEELDQYELDLPSTIQGSIKALRRVLANPEYYWCLAEKSFVHETMSSNIKKNLKHAELRDWLKKERRDMHKSKGNLRDVESLMNKLDRKLAFMDRRLSSIISDPSLTSSHPVLETSINNVKSQLKDLQTILLQSTDGEEVTANAASTTTA